MRQNLFLDLTPCFGVFSDKMGSQTRKTGPSSFKKGKQWVKLVQNRAKFGIFSTFWIFPEQQYFLWEV